MSGTAKFFFFLFYFIFFTVIKAFAWKSDENIAFRVNVQLYMYGFSNHLILGEIQCKKLLMSVSSLFTHRPPNCSVGTCSKVNHAFQVKLEFRNYCCFLLRGENWSTQRKTLGVGIRTNNKLSPHTCTCIQDIVVLSKYGHGALTICCPYTTDILWHYYSTHCDTAQIWSWWTQYTSPAHNRYPAIYIVSVHSGEKWKSAFKK